MKKLLIALLTLIMPVYTFASEADLLIPDLTKFEVYGMDGWNILFYGIGIILLGMFLVYGNL